MLNCQSLYVTEWRPVQCAFEERVRDKKKAIPKSWIEKSSLAISKQLQSPKMIKKEKQKSEKRERLTEAVQKMKLMLSGLRGVSRVTWVLAVTKFSTLHGGIHYYPTYHQPFSQVLRSIVTACRARSFLALQRLTPFKIAYCGLFFLSFDHFFSSPLSSSQRLCHFSGRF